MKTLSLTLLVFCTSCFTIGCGYKSRVDRAIETIDKLINKLDSAKNMVESESGKWRSVVRDAIKDAGGEASNIIARDLKNVAGYAITEAGVEIRCDWTFARKSVKSALQSIIDALEKKKKELKEAGKVDGTVKDVLQSIAADPHLPPFVCNAVPDAVVLERQSSGALAARTNEETVLFTGFGFDDSVAKKWDAKLFLDGKEGRYEIPRPEDAISVIGQFKLRVNLPVIVQHVRPGDTKLVLQIGESAHEVTLNRRPAYTGKITKQVNLAVQSMVDISPRHRSNGGVIAVHGARIKLMTPKKFRSVTRNFSTFPVYDGYSRSRYSKHAKKFLEYLSRPSRSVNSMYIPKGGDSNFGGNGPLMTFDVNFSHNKSSVVVVCSLAASEWDRELPGGDFTFGTGFKRETFRLDHTDVEDWEIVKIESIPRSQFSLLPSKNEGDLTVRNGVVDTVSFKGRDMTDTDGTEKRFRCTVKLSGVRVLLARKGQYRLLRDRRGRVIRVLPRD